MTEISLKEQLLQQKAKSQAKRPAEVQEKLDRMMEELKVAGKVSGLKIGDKVDNFTVKDVSGNDVELYKELVKGPVVLAFYRGSWCPYCNLQLRAYQALVPELKKLNTQLIAISPQLPDDSLTLEDKNAIPFKVLSDIHGKVAEQFKINFGLSNEVKEVYMANGNDLSVINGSDAWTLPVPAVFIIDKAANIAFASVNPDWTLRPEPDQILEAVKIIENS